MATFKYKALQANGSVAEVVLEASGRPEALRMMETRGLRPVNLVEKAGSAKKGGGAKAAPLNLSFKFESKKVPAKALENFTRLLSSLLAAGVPLSRAMVILY